MVDDILTAYRFILLGFEGVDSPDVGEIHEIIKGLELGSELTTCPRECVRQQLAVDKCDICRLILEDEVVDQVAALARQIQE